MEKLTIKLDCNKKTCGKCKHQVEGINGARACGVFVTLLKITGKNRKDRERLPECIAACKAQKGD
jgi:hypothetical protein